MFTYLNISTSLSLFLFFFFNDTATTKIYTLSLHDALPISSEPPRRALNGSVSATIWPVSGSITTNPNRNSGGDSKDRKSTRLNSSHGYISYAVFCLKKKKKKTKKKKTIQ